MALHQAAAAGNTEATGRLTALAAPNAAPLSRAEHETLTDARLVRKHTKAKNTAAAAGRIAQAKGEDDRKAMEGAAHAAADSKINVPAARPGQLPLPNTGLNSPPRMSSPQGQGQGSTSPKRRPATSPQRPVQMPGRQRYTLMDEGFQNPALAPQAPVSAPASAPVTPGTAPTPEPPSPTPVAAKPPPKKGAQTFAEMGYHSAPVDEKDCVIM